MAKNLDEGEAMSLLEPRIMKPKLVVRLSTSVFKQGGKYVFQKSLRELKRKSTIGLDDMFSDIEHELETLVNSKGRDGIYEVVMINESVDPETGVVDDWELSLVPIS